MVTPLGDCTLSVQLSLHGSALSFTVRNCNIILFMFVHKAINYVCTKPFCRRQGYHQHTREHTVLGNSGRVEGAGENSKASTNYLYKESFYGMNKQAYNEHIH